MTLVIVVMRSYSINVVRPYWWFCMLAVLLCMFLVFLLRLYSHGSNITRGSHVI